MSRKQRMQSLQEAKDRRMKKIAIGGAVVLAVVLAFEVPKVLGGGSKSSSPPAATTTSGTSTTATGTPAAATTPPGTAAAALPQGSTKLPNSDLQPRHSKSQLFSFNHFTGKDPFVQQVSSSPPAPTSSASSGSASSGNGGSGNSSSGNSAPQKKQSRTLAATGAARIAVNGRVELVKVGASFPSSNPLFRLVGVGNGAVRIGIANGSYSSGARTISLSASRTLTLVDTADGIRYLLRLITG